MVRRSTWMAAKAPFDPAARPRHCVNRCTGPICRRHPRPPASYCALIHGYYWLLLAEGHLTRRLFAGMLAKIAMLPSPAAKPVPSGAAGNTVGQDGVKPCKGKPFDVTNQLELN
jgi:hypothetical protein